MCPPPPSVPARSPCSLPGAVHGRGHWGGDGGGGDVSDDGQCLFEGMVGAQHLFPPLGQLRGLVHQRVLVPGGVQLSQQVCVDEVFHLQWDGRRENGEIFTKSLSFFLCLYSVLCLFLFPITLFIFFLVLISVHFFMLSFFAHYFSHHSFLFTERCYIELPFIPLLVVCKYFIFIYFYMSLCPVDLNILYAFSASVWNMLYKHFEFGNIKPQVISIPKSHKSCEVTIEI